MTGKDKDYYSILNIDPSAGLKEIKSAYRQMALKYHPDHNPGDKQALDQFNLVKKAYETLRVPELRKVYDKTHRPLKKQKPTVTTDFKSSGKFFKNNLRYNLYITLEDTVKGCEKKISYIRKNENRKETVQLKIKVPKGAFHHQRLKISEYGNKNHNISGNLFVIIHLQDHPIFIRKGLDLKINVPMSYLDALLGENLEIPTLFGLKKLKLKICDFENLNFTWKGLGLTDPKGQSQGDLHIHCFIENPENLSIKDKNALQKLQKSWPQGKMMGQYQSFLNKFKESKGN